MKSYSKEFWCLVVIWGMIGFILVFDMINARNKSNPDPTYMLVYVVADNYDDETDSYAYKAYSAEKDTYYTDTVSSLDYEINEEGYICMNIDIDHRDFWGLKGTIDVPVKIYDHVPLVNCNGD